MNALTLPALAVNLAVGAMLVYYCAITVQLSGDSARAILWSSTLSTAVLVPLSTWLYLRWLRTINGLGRGKLPPTEANLEQAAREAARFPDRQFWVVFCMWAGGTTSTMPVLVYAAGLPTEAAAKIIFSGLTLGPIGALFTYLLVVLQSRRIHTALSELGLGPEGISRAVPPVRRSIRLRLVVFAAVLVIAPSLIAAHLSLSLLTDGMNAVRDAPTAALKSAAAAQAVESAVWAVVVLGSMLLVFALGIAWAAGDVIGRPLQALADAARHLTGEDTRRLALVPAEDELWAVSCAFHGLQAQTAEVLAQLRSAGTRISGATETLLTVARSSEQGTETQASALGATSATTDELAQAAQLIASSAAEVAQAAQKAAEAASQGQQSSRAFLECTERLRQDNSALSAAVTLLRERVQRISQIVEFINGVADRADLLALNAELEGTKAGEIGRGFSLVAGEMRRMAEQVVRTTREIEALIADVHRAAEAANTATVQGQQGTQRGAGLALQLSEMLDRIHELSRETALAAESISQATGRQRSGASELAAAMASVLQVTDRNVATTRDMVGATQGMEALSGALAHALDGLRRSA